MAVSGLDGKGHYGVIIIGAGVSGLAANIQLKRKLGYTDVICYEGDSEVGGTWYANKYPGASVDIPTGFYSFSFAGHADFSGQWVGQAETLDYVRKVKKQFNVNNIVFRTLVTSAKWSTETGTWTVEIENKDSGVKSIKTCNVLISAVGGLREPLIPEFALAENNPFKGEIFHSARWNDNVDLTGKNVVLVGNGCSAAQIVPVITPKVAKLTQVARSRQAILPRPPAPDGWFWWLLLRWVPGMLKLQRILMFFGGEAVFKLAYAKKGKKMRAEYVKLIRKYVEATAPKKYWEYLTPDFEVSAKRRIYEDPKTGYVATLNNPKFNLVQDDTVVALTEDSVVTAKGESIKADVVVLSTGFLAQDFMAPLKVVNGQGEDLVHRLKTTHARTYHGTFVSGYPNLGILMGPNTVTGHSSVIFTSECQINLILKTFAPVLKKAQTQAPGTGPYPSVEITLEAELKWFKQLRAAMKNMIWEDNGGISWYVDRESGVCTTLYPYNQTTFWWNTLWPVKSHYRRIGL